MEEDDASLEKATDEDIQNELSVDGETEENQDDFVYFKSSSIISILIIVVVSLVCLLATSLVIRAAFHSHSITQRLSKYLGFTPNRTMDESILTFWKPKSIHEDDQPIEMMETTMILSSSPPIDTAAEHASEKPKELHKSQTIFRNFILPTVLLLSILLAILAFYIRINHHSYPAWGARPKPPDKYISVELK